MGGVVYEGGGAENVVFPSTTDKHLPSSASIQGGV